MDYPDIKFSCPHCEATLQVRPEAASLTGPCPKCGEGITAPPLEDKPKAIPADKPLPVKEPTLKKETPKKETPQKKEIVHKNSEPSTPAVSKPSIPAPRSPNQPPKNETLQQAIPPTPKPESKPTPSKEPQKPKEKLSPDSSLISNKRKNIALPPKKAAKKTPLIGKAVEAKPKPQDSKKISPAPKIPAELKGKSLEEEKTANDSKDLSEEKKQRPASEENHHRKHPRSIFALIIPFLVVCLIPIILFFALKFVYKGGSDLIDQAGEPPENNYQSELPTQPESTPLPILVKPNIADPADSSPTENDLEVVIPDLPPSEEKPPSPGKLEHDPQDQIRPGEIPPLDAGTSLSEPFEGTLDISTIIWQSRYCFDPVPGASLKATCHLEKNLKAYLPKRSPRFQKLAHQLPAGERALHRLTLAWNNTEDPERPYLEVLEVR